MNMSKLIRTTADILFPLILVFGYYIVLHGHLTPGGGFQGGAVIATGFVLLFVAYKIDTITSLFTKKVFQNCETLGLFLFVGTGFLAVILGVTYLMNFLANTGGLFGQVVPFGMNPGFLNTAGIIPILNIAVGIEVLGGLSIIIMYMTKGIHWQEDSE